MKRRAWTSAELAVLKAAYADEITSELAKRIGRPLTSVYRKASALGLRKSQAFLDSPGACSLRRGDDVGKATRFRKGNEPWNKGMNGLDIGGRSHETRFVPGHRGGRAAEVYRQIGSERVTKDGYLQRKVNDDLPLQRRWKMVHHLVWEEHNGPIPKGSAIRFLNGDKRDTRIENLELITRRALMDRNTVQRLPKALRQVVQLKGAVTRQINKRVKG